MVLILLSILAKMLRDNNSNLQKKENILKINILKSKIDKEKINGFINQLDILKSKIESRILNDL